MMGDQSLVQTVNYSTSNDYKNKNENDKTSELNLSLNFHYENSVKLYKILTLTKQNLTSRKRKFSLKLLVNLKVILNLNSWLRNKIK